MVWLKRHLTERDLRAIDARWLQIAALSSFIAYALFQLHAAILPANAVAFVGTAIACEWLCCRCFANRDFDARSPLITALSLTLLLRTDELLIAVAAAVIAIAAKHLLRVRGKHVFNPSNIAIVGLTVGTHSAWVSPGTWGHTALPVAAVACVGMLVTARATRLDLALAFVGMWATALIARALWLGDPLEIPLHQLCDGTLLVFSFFMITDPRATPDDRRARFVFAALLVAIAYALRFHAWQPDALLWALAIASPLVPLLDLWRPAPRFRWQIAQRDAAPLALSATQ